VGERHGTPVYHSWKGVHVEKEMTRWKKPQNMGTYGKKTYGALSQKQRGGRRPSREKGLRYFRPGIRKGKKGPSQLYQGFSGAIPPNWWKKTVNCPKKKTIGKRKGPDIKVRRRKEGKETLSYNKKGQ